MAAAKSNDFVLVPRTEFVELLTALTEVEALLDSLTQQRFSVRMLRTRLETRLTDLGPRKSVAEER